MGIGEATSCFFPRDFNYFSASQCVLSQPPYNILVGGGVKRICSFSSNKCEVQRGGVHHEIIHRGGTESERPSNFCCAVLWFLSSVALTYGKERHTVQEEVVV